MSTDTKNNVTVRRLFATLQGVMDKVKDLFKTGINSRPSSTTYGYTHIGTIDIASGSTPRGSLALDVYAGFQIPLLHFISATFGYDNGTIIAAYTAYAPRMDELGRFKLCYKFAEGHTANSPKIDVWLIDRGTAASFARRCACVVHNMGGVTWTDGTQDSTTALPSDLVDFSTAYPYNPIVTGTGGNASTPVYVDDSCQVVPCSGTFVTGTGGDASTPVYVDSAGHVQTGTQLKAFAYKDAIAASDLATALSYNSSTGRYGINISGEATTAASATTATNVSNSSVYRGYSDISFDNATVEEFKDPTSAKSIQQKLPFTSSSEVNRTVFGMGRIYGLSLSLKQYLRCEDFDMIMWLQSRDQRAAFIFYNDGTSNNHVTFIFMSSNGTVRSVSYSDNVNTASEAGYAAKIGTSSSHPAIGSSTTPVYVDSNGQVQQCSNLSAPILTPDTMESGKSYQMTAIDANGRVYIPSSGSGKLGYNYNNNELNVNIGGTTKYVLPDGLGNYTGLYRLLVMNDSGRVLTDTVASPTKLLYAPSSNTMSVNINGSVNGVKIVIGTYGSEDNTIYFR